MKKDEIKAKLDELGIEYDEDAKKSELEALLPEEEEISKKGGKIKITASFKAIDETDNTKVIVKFVGEGKTVADALADLRNTEDEKQEWPKGIVALVNIKVEKGDNELEKAVAPHNARKILELKDTVVFNRIFSGI